MNAFVVIPARYHSTRLPAKLLREIAGVPMIVRTARQALKSGLPVWVAYDEVRIAEALATEAVQTIATSAHHQNGSERLSEVVQRLGWDDEMVVVNVQGDEPMMPPELIKTVAECLRQSPEAAVATLAVRFSDKETLHDATAVKVVCNQKGQALYFSRAPIPWVRDRADEEQAEYLRHIGIYAYRVATLRRYPQLLATPLERLEKLEQLRFLEYGLTVAVAVVDEAPPAGVDCEQDLARVEALLTSQSLQ